MVCAVATFQLTTTTTSVSNGHTMAWEVEDPVKSLGEHLPIKRHKTSPHVQLLQRHTNISFFEKVLGKSDFPVDLAKPSLNIIGYCEPFSTDKLKKSLDGNMDV